MCLLLVQQFLLEKLVPLLSKVPLLVTIIAHQSVAFVFLKKSAAFVF